MSEETQTQTTETANKEIAILTKMSVKALGCNPKKANALDPEKNPEDRGRRLRLCLIYGRATGVVTGEDAKGDVWSALAGNFEGVNLETGKKYQSGKLFLPGGIHESIESPLSAAKEVDKSATVDFAFEIRVYQAANPIGYSYEAVSLVKPEATDFFTSMRNSIAGRAAELGLEVPLKLEAPAQEQKRIEAPAETAQAPAETHKKAGAARK